MKSFTLPWWETDELLDWAANCPVWSVEVDGQIAKLLFTEQDEPVYGLIVQRSASTNRLRQDVVHLHAISTDEANAVQRLETTLRHATAFWVREELQVMFTEELGAETGRLLALAAAWRIATYNTQEPRIPHDYNWCFLREEKLKGGFMRLSQVGNRIHCLLTVNGFTIAGILHNQNFKTAEAAAQVADPGFGPEWDRRCWKQQPLPSEMSLSAYSYSGSGRTSGTDGEVGGESL